MGIFKKLGAVVFDVVTTPIAVVKDVATLGGQLAGRDEPYTVKKLNDLNDDVESIGKELRS